jgi:uncharacterized protein YegP (UPF0339 family)
MAHIEVWSEPKGLMRKRREYYWRIKATNGKIMVTGGEGYYNLGDLWHAIAEIRKTLGIALTQELPVHEGKPPN